MSDKNRPAIRFKGFDAEWEQRKLGEITEKVLEKNADLQFTETFTNSAEYGIISQKDFFDHSISKMESLNGYYIVRSDDFVYNPRISVTAPVGPINRNKLGRAGVMSPLYTVLRPHNVENIYLDYFFKSTHWHEFMFLNGDSGARSDRFSIKDSTLAYMPIPIPCVSEQKDVGQFFDKLHHLINVTQRKHDKLVSFKKAMLDKMFPKEGCNVPEIRFKGFTGEWEQCKLGDLGDIVTGSTPSTAHTEFYSNDGIPWVTPTDITSNLVSDTAKRLSKEGEKIGRVVPPNTILVTCIASIGKNALLKVKGSFNQQINSLTPNNENDSYFLLTESELWSLQMKQQAAAATMQIVNKTEFSEMKTFVPKKEEQIQIGLYFKNLDHLISLQQKKLDNLKSIKQSLLDKMFV